jgi:hypothetical protein
MTGILTTVINNLVRIPILATWIGILIGIIVGAILCLLCRNTKRGCEDERYDQREG